MTKSILGRLSVQEKGRREKGGRDRGGLLSTRANSRVVSEMSISLTPAAVMQRKQKTHRARGGSARSALCCRRTALFKRLVP